MFIRRLTKGDAPTFWRLRLIAVQSEPTGFAESAAEHEALGIAGTEARIEAGNGVDGKYFDEEMMTLDLRK
ncbi:MAG TPA: hypothetical protein VIY69_06990 [Candidatus Acidoferrales bacterium]